MRIGHRAVGAVCLAAVVVLGCTVPPSRPARSECAPQQVPIGAVAPAPPPAWCQDLARGKPTFRASENTWLDTFDNGQQHAAMAAGYRVFEAARPSEVWRSKHFMHSGHWMVDVAARGNPPGQYEGDARDVVLGRNWGGSLMRPEQAFHFADGRLVVEVDVSASMEAYALDAWPEIVVAAADAPTGRETDPLHAIGVFGGAPSVGCQLRPDRRPVCTGYDGSGRSAVEGGRIFELAGEADRLEDNSSAAASMVSSAWRLCRRGEPDANCRDRFRLDLRQDSLQLSVNGTTYIRSHLPPGAQLPDGLVNGKVYVYFGSWIYRGDAATIRFHWGRIAINPGR